MKLKEITLSKSYKLGLPNYSSVGFTVTAAYLIEEGEQPDCDHAWKAIDAQIEKKLQEYSTKDK